MREWNLGEVIDGRFRLRERVGEGWAGVVYRADVLDAIPGGPPGGAVALKRYRPEIYNADPNTHERIRREAAAGALLDHPNIVRIFSLEEDDDTGEQYLVMEYCEGGSYAEWLRVHWPLPEDTTVDHTRGLAAGLSEFHSAGLVHRDIKPQNILVGDAGQPKIGDFGVVRHKDDMTITNASQFLGTIRYSPREYLIDGMAVEASDVYSLGTVFYEILYSKAVWSEVTRFTSLVLQIENAAVEFPASGDRFGVPASFARIVLETICMGMLETDPKARPAIAAVAELLDGDGSPQIELVRARLSKEVEAVIASNRERFIQENVFVFSKYVSPIVAEALTDEDAVAFLAEPTADFLLHRDEYKALATAGLPPSDAYAELPREERARVLDVIDEEGETFYFQSTRDADRFRKFEAMKSYFERCLSAESDAGLRARLEKEIESLDRASLY